MTRETTKEKRELEFEFACEPRVVKNNIFPLQSKWKVQEWSIMTKTILTLRKQLFFHLFLQEMTEKGEEDIHAHNNANQSKK
jgi:hypothetical protein